MKSFKLFMIPFLCFVLMAGCKKDEKTECQKLEGKWQLTSWREDGEEYFGTFITNSVIDFDKLDGDEGDFDWLITYFDGTSESIFGEYEGNSSCTEITLSADGSTPFDLDFEITDDELVLDGIIDGFAVELEFERD